MPKGDNKTEKLGTLGDVSGKLGWTATGGAGRDAMGAGSVGVMSVMLETMRESASMAEK